MELKVEVEPELVEPIVDLFQRYGKQSPVVEETGGFNPDDDESPPEDVPIIVRVFLPVNKGVAKKKSQIEAGYLLLSLIRPLPEIQSREFTDKEWIEQWKATLRPLRIGDQFIVTSPEQPTFGESSDISIILDQGLAFGTGYHPTTQMCLTALASIMKPGLTVLDLGTGSGILSIAAAKLGAAKVLSVDTDAQSISAARKNVRLNGLSKQVRVIKGTLPLQDVDGFEVVLANISASVLIRLSEPLALCLIPNGLLVASGFIEERSDEVEKALLDSRFQILTVWRQEDWVTFLLRRS